MPEITSSFTLNLEKSVVLAVINKSFEDIGGTNTSSSENSGTTTLKTTVPSIWGWGGMNVIAEVSNIDTGQTQVALTGYIAQLATRPLKKVLKQFMISLETNLKNLYNYDFNYGTAGQPVLNTKTSLTPTDKKIIVFILALVFIQVLAGKFSAGLGLLLGGAILYGGYYFGRKYLNR